MNYDSILQNIMVNGTRTANRTGIDTVSIPSAMFEHDMREGFPAITRRKLFTKSVFAELLCFLNGCTNAEDFRIAGTKIWDANANKNEAWLTNPYRKGEDDLGRIYGSQWRSWRAPNMVDSEDFCESVYPVDQLYHVLTTLSTNPTNRRMLVSAWNPGELDQMALPPCHFAWQLIATPDRVLHLNWSQRSCDAALGIPFNIASYAALLQMICHCFGYEPGKLTGFLSDVHIYVNHLEAVARYLQSPAYGLPTLSIKWPEVDAADPVEHFLTSIQNMDADCFELNGYTHGPHIPMDMAV